MFFIIVAAISVYAQAQQGCCCDPVTGTGTFESYTSCAAKNYRFIGPPQNITTTCNQMCNATRIVPPAAPVGQCGAPGYKPAPSNAVASPVKGQKAIKLDFNMPCPADYVKIFRCKGAVCANFTEVARIAPTNTYTDSSSSLLWDQAYTYRIMAHYNIAGDSFNASLTANPGDIECWGQQGTSIFCISRFFYSQDDISLYLKANGYKLASDDAFTSNFSDSVRSTFNSLFEKAWFCNQANKVARPSPATECTGSKICVSDGTAARCAEPSACNLGGQLGLFPNLASCEGTATATKNYCFLDRSKSIVDKCYQCSAQMKCYDYHSKASCDRDNCGIGQCAWKDVFPALGAGTCYDTRFDACNICGASFTINANNKEGYNSVFDACTEEKAAALSTPAKTCFFDKNQKFGKSCESADCTLYTQAQCSSPAGGIALNPDNSLRTFSSDPCGVKVCQYSSDTGCVKNADGSTGAGWQDCYGADNPQACEKDYLPPETILYATGLKPGRHDFINIVIKDKPSRDVSPREMQGQLGYKTYLCIVSSTTACNAASQFTISTNATQLNINDLNLQDGQQVIGRLQTGTSVIKYYSVDKYNNPEVINKSIAVLACDKCSGPKVLSVAVANARKVGDAYYTNSLQPIITVTFNKPAQLTASSLAKESLGVQIASSPASGANYQYTFRPNSPLSEGKYVFSLNSVDNNTVQMEDPLSFVLEVDTTPPTVVISPPDASEFTTASVAVALNFSEPVLLGSTSLDEIIFVDKLAKKAFPLDLPARLKTADNRSFAGTVSNLREGLKVINVKATDYASNQVLVKSSFSVITAAPQMRLKSPSWGIALGYTFDVIVETSSAASCKYIYDLPTPPPEDQFDTFANFDSTGGIEHKITGFNKIPFGDGSVHKMHVYCKTEKFGTTKESFDIHVDTIPPLIVSSYAQPNPIVEPIAPNTSVYMTRLQVQTNKEGFCKYSQSKQNFADMEGFFPGFDEDPKKSHSTDVNVTQITNQTFYVACKSLSGMASPTVMIKFYVDLTQSFKITSITPPYSSDGIFFLSIEANKKSFCYFGEDAQAITNCFGNCSFGTSHVQQVSKPAGTHTFYVKCNTGAGGAVSNVTAITVAVDNTPPFMVLVDDSSTLPGQPDISWYSNKLRLRFLGGDNESRVVSYYYMLEAAFTRDVLVNWTPSLELNGSPIYVQANLTDGTRYIFRVKPVNIAGLEGEPVASDGVTVDATKAPPGCVNGEADLNETDIDCGGSCAGCAAGKLCKENTDCDSMFCTNGTCAAAACDDGFRNGKETDVDCGGSGCAKCELNKTCAIDTDCGSSKCKYGQCIIPGPCENGVLDGSESDIDCGGACPDRCASGQNCNLADDCLSELRCAGKTCRDPTAEGFNLADLFSCDDEIDDAWRINHFGSVLCDGDGAPDADPDKDGLNNIEEYRAGTNPKERDSDKDGWSDKQEIDAGTNPLDKTSHPSSMFLTFLKIIFILALIGGAGYGTYYGYTKGYFEKWIEEIKKKLQKAPPEKIQPEIKPRPAAPRPMPMEKINPLRKLVRKKEAPEEFISLEEIKKRIEKPGDSLEKLRALKKKPKLVDRAPKEEAISKLRDVKANPSEDALSRLKKLKRAK